MKKLIATVSAAAIAFAGASAFAGEKTMDEWFASVDTNGDGVISEAEYVADKEAYARKKFAKMAGDDGQLTKEDIKAYKKKAHKKHKKEKKEKKG
jgi:hypothetical protein